MHGTRRCPVVVLDDEADYCSLVADILREEGWRVSTFTTGRGALAHLRALEEPALLLLDWRMPEMDGARVLEVLQREALLGRLVVVVCSALLHVPAHPAVAWVLKKPFHISQLIALVERGNALLAGPGGGARA